jgi:hypothetical protein
MPTFDVNVIHTVQFSTTVTVRAQDEEAAEAKVDALFATSPVEWKVVDTKHDWECDQDATTVEEVVEA